MQIQHEASVAPTNTPGSQAEQQGSPWTLLLVAGAVLLLFGLIPWMWIATAVVITMMCVFGIFFLRHLGFALVASRHAAIDIHRPAPHLDRHPAVSVLVAARNEERVVDNLVEGLQNLEYPVGALEIIIVDDASEDGTGARLDQLCEPDPRMRVIHRKPDSGGGKSGALNEALAVAKGEIIVIYDADHRPRPDSLARLVSHFADPDVAAVQGRCVISNGDESIVSRVVAAEYMSGYLVNEYGRQGLFELPAYGGANCAVRASDLRSVGGWNPESVTEDTDLTIRLVVAGKKVRYDVSAVDEEQGVTTIAGYWRQRYRWARGHQKVWRDYRRAVVDSPHLNPLQKIESILFLFGFHLPALSAAGLIVLPLWIAGIGLPTLGVGTFALWTLLFLGPLLEVGAGLLIAPARRSMASTIAYFIFFYVVSMALCSKALVDGLLGRPYSWVKTNRSPSELAANGGGQ